MVHFLGKKVIKIIHILRLTPKNFTIYHADGNIIKVYMPTERDFDHNVKKKVVFHVLF